ncbi:hypothetical protein LP125_206 [Listeria phage LP-125]|uniref:Transmembrane protein n=7 Tax=Pecentumvirus TaxID=1857844 RepID=W0GBL6_9CAUD|nr:hypothetical protein QLX35_gp099 [Listeria phage LP-125]YP_009044621.1 hypothetical protein LP083-2_165 [Listeria phage LP-083-2]YP_009592698.1 hypothetical protein FDG78_gp098 [Listeria phage LP-064]YP_009784598.1 hypothetical protein QLX40_gp086 [Listeria phage LP-124]QIG61091.1 hypothetical protein vBLivaVAfA18_167 [Listeria phage vB_Liva_VAfA18]AHF53407.1 hypothetical protein LP125_206 [Listeria phage LP-125]AHL19189.1 hypothetical protein LP064_167 [Listeria phage LP-064]AHL19372.1 h
MEDMTFTVVLFLAVILLFLSALCFTSHKQSWNVVGGVLLAFGLIALFYVLIMASAISGINGEWFGMRL